MFPSGTDGGMDKDGAEHGFAELGVGGLEDAIVKSF